MARRWLLDGRGRTSLARAPDRGSRGLDWFSFFVANLQTGFGPFVSIHLTVEKWSQADIGLVLTLGGLAGLAGQIPGGAIVDGARSKRAVAAISVVLVGVSALGLALSPAFPVILIAWLLHAFASCTLTPAIASVSLGLVGHDGVSRRLGRNASFASAGGAIAAAGMGACGYYLSNQIVFIVTAALMIPALVALVAVPAGSPAILGAAAPVPETSPSAGWRDLASDRTLLILAFCTALFHLANAGMLPLLAGAMTERSAAIAPALVAAFIIVPQVIVAVSSTWVGAKAQAWGRRPFVLAAFAALTFRAILFGLVRDPWVLMAVQLLDGISAAIVGVVVPTMIADATRDKGRFALAQGMIGAGMGIGAALSTSLAGSLAEVAGVAFAFYGLAAAAGLGLAVAILGLPETLHRPRADGQ